MELRALLLMLMSNAYVSLRSIARSFHITISSRVRNSKFVTHQSDACVALAPKDNGVVCRRSKGIRALYVYMFKYVTNVARCTSKRKCVATIAINSHEQNEFADRYVHTSIWKVYVWTDNAETEPKGRRNQLLVCIWRHS